MFANGFFDDISHLKRLKTNGTIISSQSNLLFFLPSSFILDIIPIALFLISINRINFPPKRLDIPMKNQKQMSSINAITKQSNSAKQAKS